MCVLSRTLKPSAPSDSFAISRSTVLNVAFAGLTSATVSPGASRFGLIAAGAAAAHTRGAGSWAAGDAMASGWTRGRRFMAGILSDRPRGGVPADPPNRERLSDSGVEMEEHGREPAGADDHVLGLCPRRDERGAGVWHDDVRSASQPHFEMTRGIGRKGGGHSISLPHCEAGTERRLARQIDLAYRLEGTAHDGPDKSRVARRGRPTASCCPAEQSHGQEGCSSHEAVRPYLDSSLQISREIDAINGPLTFWSWMPRTRTTST